MLDLKFPLPSRNSQDAVVCFDDLGTIQSWNLGAQDLFAFKEEEIVGRKIGLLIPDEFWRKYADDVKKELEQYPFAKHSRSISLYGTNKFGGNFPADICLTAWRTCGKNYFISIIRDLSLDKHHEAIAEEYVDIYKALLQAQSDLGEGTAIFGAESQGFLYVNEAFCKIYGYTSEEMMALPDRIQLVAPELREFVSNRVKKRMKNHWSTDHYESIHVKKDGTRFFVEASLKNCETSFGPSIVAIVRDVTRRKVNEQALIEQKRLHDDALNEERLSFKALAEASSEAIALHKDRRIFAANQSFCSMFGYTYEQAIGLKTDDFMHESEVERSRAHIANDSEEPFIAFGKRRDGSKFQVELSPRTIVVEGKKVRVTKIKEIKN